jgi:hypothetical protein
LKKERKEGEKNSLINNEQPIRRNLFRAASKEIHKDLMNSFPAGAAVIPVKTRQSILINVCIKRNFSTTQIYMTGFFFSFGV